MSYYAFLNTAFSIERTADTVVSNALLISERTNGAVMAITPSEQITLNYAVYPTDDTQKSKAEKLAGTGAGVFGSEVITQPDVWKGYFGGLSANTAYKVHYYTVGTTESEAQMSGSFTTYDQVNAVEGVSLDLSGSNVGTDSLVNSSNVAGEWSQTNASNQPVFANGKINMDGSDYLSGPDHYLNPREGFNIWIVFDRTNTNNHYILGEFGLQTYRASLLITSTQVNFSVSARTIPAFNHAVPTGSNMLRIQYDGNTTYNLYDQNNALLDTQQGSSLNAFAPVFNRIGGPQGQENVGLEGSIYRVVVLDNNETNSISYIHAKVKAVDYDRTEAEAANALNNVPCNLLRLAGDSMAAGFDQITNLTDSSLTNQVPRGFVLSSLDYMLSEYQPADAHTGETLTDTFGNELGFLWENHEQSNKYGIVIKYGIPSTTLESRTGTNNDWDAQLTGESYFNFNRVAQFSLQLIKSNLFEFSEAPLNLHIGTNDAQDASWSGNYKTNMQNFVAQHNVDFGAETIRVPSITSRTFASTINNSLSELDRLSSLSESISNLHYITGNSAYTKKADGIHLIADDLVQEGRDIYNYFNSTAIVENHTIVSSGNGVFTASYSVSGLNNLESNKSPELREVVITSDGDINNLQVGDTLTAALVKEKFSPNINWDTDEVIWFRSNDQLGSGKTQIGTVQRYQIAESDTGSNEIYVLARAVLEAKAGNRYSKQIASAMVGPTPVNIPFGTVQPDVWVRGSDWSLTSHTANNLGLTGGVASVPTGRSNPLAKNGNAVIVNADSGGMSIQLPVGATNPESDGELTIFIKCRITDTNNAGIICASNSIYFQARSSDLQLRATTSSNFTTVVSDINGPSSVSHTFLIRIKQGANNSTVEVDFNDTQIAQTSGTPSATTLSDFIIGATSSSYANPAENIEFEEVIIFKEGRYDESTRVQARTYFGF